MSIFSPGSRGIRPFHVDSPLEKGFWNAAVPSMCVVPLQQHLGSKIEPLVEKGDLVREGMVIAESDRRLAIPLHAPIPGRIRELGDIELFDGTVSPAMAIELDGEFDRLGKHVEPIPWESADREELLQRIRAAGVVCGPRSAVPAHAYLGPKGTSSESLVVLDLAENEPYLTAGIELSAHDHDAILTGTRIVSHVVGSSAVHVVLGRAVSHRLRRLKGAARDAGFHVHIVANRFPGLTDEVLDRNVNQRRGKKSVRPDRYVISPETAFAIYEAVVFGKPQIDRVLAVGGSAVRRPAHVRARIGTSIASVLEECGGLTVEPARITIGGPLTGQLVTNVNAPITKSTVAVVAMRADEVKAGSEEPCIGCGACVRACPVQLDPQLLHRHLLAGRTGDAAAAGLDRCIECGLCSHVCPSRIPLAGTFRKYKGKNLAFEGDSA